VQQLHDQLPGLLVDFMFLVRFSQNLHDPAHLPSLCASELHPMLFAVSKGNQAVATIVRERAGGERCTRVCTIL
jgi:hypothetical protein